MKITIGLFDTQQQAQAAIEEMVAAGVDTSHVSLVVNNGIGLYEQYTGADAILYGRGKSQRSPMRVDRDVSRGYPVSSLSRRPARALVGGYREPEMDLLMGTVLSELVSAGIPDQTAAYLIEGVRRGATLFMAEVPDSAMLTALLILDHHGAVDLPSRVHSWLQRGWDPYYTETTPYTPEQMQAEVAYYDEDATVPL